MSHNRAHGFFASVVVATVALLPFAGAALAGAQDYRFEAVQPQVKSGKDREIAVRLIHVPSGKPVSNAVIFQTRLDMSPNGMADMAAKVKPLTSNEPGVYRFQAGFGMAGGWAFNLAAKVPGETETVRGKVVITATK